MNLTPLRREVAQTIESLESAVARLRERHKLIENESDSERENLIAEATTAIERAKRNGNGYRIWERLLTEFVAGSADQRGTDFDGLRKFASALDHTQGMTIVPYIRCSAGYHPRTLEEAQGVVDAYPDFRWVQGYAHSLRGVFKNDADAFYEQAELTLYYRTEWRSALVDYVNGASETAGV